MKKLEITIISSLLLVAAGVPVVQAVHDIAANRDHMPQALRVFTQWPTKKNLHKWDADAKDQSIFAKAIRPAVLQLRYDLLGETGHKALVGVDDWLFYTPDVEYLMFPDYKNYRFYHGSFDTVVAGKGFNVRNPIYAIMDFRDQLRARGIDLLVVPVPGKPSIYPEKLAPGIKAPPASPTLKLIEELRNRGLNVVDLYTPILGAKGHTDQELYLRRDTHWSPAGLKVAAAAIAAQVKSFPGFAPSGDTPKITQLLPNATAGRTGAVPARRYSLKDTSVERWGDIAEMTKLPDRQKIWKLQTVRAEQVIDNQTGKPYDPTANYDSARILWLGDSYSRIYQTDEPKSAGVISHVAYDLDQPLASIVNDGGASTIVRQKLMAQMRKLKGKRLVIWEIVERDIRFGDRGWQLETLPPDI